jgi:hypothetical protein
MFSFNLLLEQFICFSEIMKKSGNSSEKSNSFSVNPGVLIALSEYVSGGHIRGNCPQMVERTNGTYYPNQFGSASRLNPMTGNGSVLSCRLTKERSYGIEPLLSN